MCCQNMVSAAQVECVVRDCTNNSGNERLEFTLPASTTVHDFVCQVAEKMNYEPHSIQLTMLDDDTKVYTEKTSGSLESVGFSTGTNQRNSLILEGIRGNSKNLVIKYPPGDPSSSEDSAVASPPPLDQFPGYVGLVNQAMTCYLNSLLQALYMTPEFRNALYKWQFDVSSVDETKCIPFQLQKLFLSLQRSSKSSIETTELTRSFGWESGEVWQQHDIQELCRVMFDALEHEFKETEQADLINRLYQGKMIDYVKCLECGLEKSREDTFLDIPLPVRPFGSTIAYGSIEEALRAFVQPETLDGNNQYFCEACNKKCDAHKGLKFSKFPYLLTLHLKRFDFDYSTMHRIKLNDKVVFPEILDLNNFVSCNNSVEEIIGEGQDSMVRNDDSSTADSALDEELQQHTTHIAEPQNNEIDQDEDEGIDLSSNSGNHENDKNRQENSSPPGPFVYELYSIMIHSGSASGGHYYAYIKDFKKGKWFCFNDQSVTRLTHEDIKKTYGGGPARGYYSGAYSSSTNAYMLMYRQIDKELNCFAMTEDEFPPHMMKLLEDLREAEEKEKALKARQEEMIRIKVHTCHPVNGSPKSNKIYCHSDSTLAEVKSMAYQYLKLEGIVSEEQCRLVSYNKSQDVLEESFDGREKETISEVFSSLRHTTNFDLFLEIREKDKLFLPYNIGDINMTVYLINVEKEEVESVSQIRTSPCQSVPDLKNLLKMAVPIKSADLHLVLVGQNTLSYINDNTLPLNKLGFSSFNRVFICYQTPGEDISQTFTSTKLYKVLDEVKNIVTLHLSLPDSCEATLESLLIPPLVEEIEIEKASDPTPSAAAGDNKVPITKWLEEEAGFAGCTSDQSTSEDSSLADSERTIIGEVVNEKDAPGSSPSDSDQQLSSPENQTPARICCQMNWGIDEENWDVENVVVNRNFYYKASSYTADDGQKMLRVVADRNMDVVQLEKKLEKYVGVSFKYMKLTRGVDGDEVCGYLKDCKDEERICVKLQRVLSEGEHRVRVNHLAPNAPTPIQYMFDWIVCNGMTIENLKKALLKETEKRAALKIPYERCRLRRQNWKSPGEVLLDWDRWEEPASRHKTELYLQQLEEGGPDPVTSSRQLLLFTRRWHPSTLRLGPFIELVLEAPSPSNLLKELAKISGIPIEHIKFAQGKTSFPCEMPKLSINDLSWESDSEWKYGSPEWRQEDGAVIFYRDDREELKPLTKEEQLEANNSQQEVSTSSNSYSYVSSYSPRKERALKIYLDTNSRRTRPVVDVD